MFQRSMLMMVAFVLVADTQAQTPAPTGVDRLGDPLPQGAVARVGTLRLKHDPASDPDILAVVFSPDGTKIASLAGQDRGSLRLWDALSGRQLPGPWNAGGQFTAVAFSPDGSTLAAAAGASSKGEDKGADPVILWDIAKAKAVATLHSRVGLSLALAFADAGKTLLVAGRNGVQWWDIGTGKEKRVWQPFAVEEQVTKGQTKAFLSCAVSPDGKHLAAEVGTTGQPGQLGRRVIIRGAGKFRPPPAPLSGAREAIGFDLDTGKATWKSQAKAAALEIDGSPSPEKRFAFSADGKRLAFSDGSENVGWRDTVTGKLLITTSIPLRKPGQPDKQSTRLALVDMGNYAFAFFAAVQMDSGPTYANSKIALSADGTTAAMVGSDGQIALCSSGEPGDLRMISAGKATTSSLPASALAFSPDGKKIVVGAGAFLTVFDIATLKETVTCDGHDAEVDFVAFSADGKRLVTGSSQKDVGSRNPLIWNTSRWEKLSPLSTPSSGLPAGGISSPDLKLYAAPGNDSGFSLYDQATGKLLANLMTPKKSIPQDSVAMRRFALNLQRGTTSAFFSPDSKYLVLADPSQSDKRSQMIYSTTSGKLLCRLPPQGLPMETLRPLAFSDDGQLVATFSAEDGKIHVFDLATGTLRHRMSALPKELTDFSFASTLAFSGDGRFLATWTTLDNAVRIWDLATGKQRARLPHNGEPRNSVHLAWSADGRMLALGDRKIQLWEMATLQIRREFTGHEGDILALTFSPDCRLLASGSKDTTVLIWDAVK